MRSNCSLFVLDFRAKMSEDLNMGGSCDWAAPPSLSLSQGGSNGRRVTLDASIIQMRNAACGPRYELSVVCASAARGVD